jgi:hypothetical protein
VIQHIVLLKWKPGTTDAQLDEAFAEAHSLVDEIDEVERVTLGRNRAEDDHGFTHAIIVKLPDEALAAYLSHPARQRYITDVLGPLEEDRIEVDVPEDAYHARATKARLGWDWSGTRGSAAAAAAALRWEERHPDDDD